MTSIIDSRFVVKVATERDAMWTHFSTGGGMQDAVTKRGAVSLPVVASVGLVAVAGVLLLAMGRDPICPCGYVKFWHGRVPSVESSQHLVDWWSFSHFIHGFWFYSMLVLVLPRLGVEWRFLLATAIEVGWEIVENSTRVIERYRAVTIAVDYNGDTVINMASDVSFMWLGFILARTLPIWQSITLVVVAEALPMLVIRDGLLLNILMLVWPIEAIANWQAGG